MGTKRHPNLLCITVLLGLTTITPIQAFVCPANETISPCRCTLLESDSENRGIITCDGNYGRINQDDLDQAFLLTREINNLHPEDWLYLARFTIIRISMPTLNLTFLMNTNVDRIDIEMSTQLETLVGPEPLDSFVEKIDTEFLNIFHCGLTNEGLGNSLKYFSPRMNSLYLRDLALKGGEFPLEDDSGDIELFPGLSALVNLTSLDLYRNGVSKLTGGQLKRNRKLKSVTFQENGEIEVGENAFLLDKTDEDFADVKFHVSFYMTQVTYFNATNVVNYNERPMSLSLGYNGLTSLPAEFFENFLNANDLNSLWLYQNPFICDPNLKWLKDQRDKFESRVTYCDCSNDRGQTCFTSDLI